MALNFDAKLTLDVSEFLASVQKAENAVKGLRAQLSAPMTLPGVKGSGGADKGLETLTQQRQKASQESMRQMAQEQAMAKAGSQMERNNAKTEWQAEMMRKKAMDDRIKDHQTLSSLSDQTIAQEQKARSAASASIKTQMQEREAMNKLHAQAIAQNKRFDAARMAADDTERNSARQRYALYDVAAAYQQVQQISVAALKAMIKTAADYERAFVNVSRTTDFVSVKIGEAAESMKYSLAELATQIPVSFGGITEIATIGNQLGIAQGELVNFTKTVAQFSTITGISVEQTALAFGRIGELLNIQEGTLAGEDAYAKLGSAIAYAGVKAVATETQIVSVTKEIATTAKLAKFTTPEVVGLATALSSVGIAPEAARGSIIRTFALINEAVGSGGEKLDAYAKVARVSSEDFAKDWTTNGEKAFDSFLSGLQRMSDSGENLDTVLRGLGIKNVRDIQTIQKLGDNYKVYADGIDNANKGFEEGAFLSAAYGQVQETVSAKLTIIQNQWNNFLASAGDASFPAIKFLLDIITQVIDRLNEFARNPFGKVVIVTTTVVLALAAAIAAVNAVVNLAKASMMAYTTAVQLGAASQVEAGAAADIMAGKVSKARIALTALQTAGKATLVLGGIALATELIAKLGDAFEKATNSSAYFTRKAEESLGGFAGMQEALAADYAAALATYGSEASVNAAIASGEIDGMTVSMENNSEEAQRAQELAAGYGVVLGSTVVDGADDATEAIEKQNIVLGQNYTAWLKNRVLQSGGFEGLANNDMAINALKEVGYTFEGILEASTKGEQGINDYLDSLAKAAGYGGIMGLKDSLNAATTGGFQKFIEAILGARAEAFLLGQGLGVVNTELDKVAKAPEKFVSTTKTLEKARTIWDYISEVQTKLKTAFDWRYASKNAADVLYTAWKKVATSFKEAEKAVKELRTSMSTLVADRSTLEYQLSIAIKYGDTLRANAIQAELNANEDKIAQNKIDQATATQNASRALRGNSDAAIRNRQEMQNLVTSSLDYLTTLKTTSKDTATLVKSAQQSKQDFMDQGKALGFNAKELTTYSKSFDDFIGIVEGTSDKLDVSMDVYLGFDGADAALHKWKTENADLSVKVKVLNPDWVAWKAKNDQTIDIKTRLIAPESVFSNYKKAKVSQAGSLKQGKETPASILKVISDFEALYGIDYGKKYAVGGLVTGPGTGTSDSVRASLSNGEFVVNAASVKRIGVGFLNALNNPQGLSMPAQTFNSAASVAGSNVVYLSPDDRALLRAAIDRPVNLYTENTKIAQSANDGNVLLAQRGRN